MKLKQISRAVGGKEYEVSDFRGDSSGCNL